MNKTCPHIFFLFIIYSTISHAFQYDRGWLNLYRYEKTWNGFDSLVTNDSWFFHENGRNDPQAELEKAIEVLSKSEQKRCLFPARTLYLRRSSLIENRNDNCPKLAYFKRKVALEKVSLVFASYYLNNPSSAFGHTLFKLKGKSHGNDLLEWGVNFAAQMTTQNPLLYSLYGLTGHFNGHFSLLPYFIKISEYNNSENRDLWEYQLNLTDNQLELFVAHLWEMDQAKFDYYYLTGNCSYHLLSFLDAIDPKLSLTKELPFFVMPSDTLKIINKRENFVTGIRRRNSQFKLTQKRFDELNKKSQEHFIETSDFLANQINLEDRQKAKYLDFSMDYVDLKHSKELTNKSSNQFKLKRKIQAQRSQYDFPTTSYVSDETQIGAPHLIHKAAKATLLYETQNYENFQQKKMRRLSKLEWRMSFHELIDSERSAPLWSELVLGKVTLAYDHDLKKTLLNHFSLIDTMAHTKSILNDLSLSWGLEAGARDFELSYQYDLGAYATPKVGINYQNKNLLSSIVFLTDFDYASTQKRNEKTKLKSSATLEWLIAYRFTSKFRMILKNSTYWSTYYDKSLLWLSQLEGQIDLTNDFALRTKLSKRDQDYTTNLGLSFYF